MKKIILFVLVLSPWAFAKNEKVKSMPQTTPAVAVANTISPSAATPPPTQELKVGVKGMVCAFCAQGIEKNFMKLPEVSKVEVSLENKYVILKFKESQTLSKEKITETLKDAGYESVFEN